MKILYLDLGMGAAGDMLCAALLDLLDDEQRQSVLDTLNNAGIPQVVYRLRRDEKCGITGLHLDVLVDGHEEGHDHHDQDHDDHHHHQDYDDHQHQHHHHDHDEHHHHYDHDHDEYHHHHGDHDDGHEIHHHEHHHHHASLEDICRIIDDLALSGSVREKAKEVYRAIAMAESRVHGKDVGMVHFHEVGAMDAVADVTAFCCLMEQIRPDRVVASPVNTGSGQVRCAHGILPVPAPATALLLEGIPAYSSSIRSELCTPTGAALIRTFADSFGEMPVMRMREAGYGTGTKDFEQANLVRAILAEGESARSAAIEFACNLDDMTAEDIAHAMQVFMDAGALDVYTIPIHMKKSRTGTLLTVMCREEDREEMIRLIFRHTTTLGIREYTPSRYTLQRHVEVRQTGYGPIRCKVSRGYGVVRVKPEYEDIAKAARETGKSILEIRESLSPELKRMILPD